MRALKVEVKQVVKRVVTLLVEWGIIIVSAILITIVVYIIVDGSLQIDSWDEFLDFIWSVL